MSENILKDILHQLKRNEYATITRFYQPPHPAKFVLRCKAGGSYLDFEPTSISDGEKIEVFRWEEKKPYISGTLFSTLMTVIMPDASNPDIAFAVTFDDNNEVIDWSPYEYKNVLGLSTPMADYGGAMLYDTTDKIYSCITLWNWSFLKRLIVNIYNYSGATVELFVWGVQVYTVVPLKEE